MPYMSFGSSESEFFRHWPGFTGEMRIEKGGRQRGEREKGWGW
jgi:hypothetical protein